MLDKRRIPGKFLSIMYEHQTELSNLLKIREMEIAAVIRVLRAQNLLKSTIVCTTCGEQMAERKKAKVPELVAWCCTSKSCPNHKTTKSIRHGSFFARYKHSLGQGFPRISDKVQYQAMRRLKFDIRPRNKYTAKIIRTIKPRISVTNKRVP